MRYIFKRAHKSTAFFPNSILKSNNSTLKSYKFLFCKLKVRNLDTFVYKLPFRLISADIFAYTKSATAVAQLYSLFNTARTKLPNCAMIRLPVTGSP